MWFKYKPEKRPRLKKNESAASFIEDERFLHFFKAGFQEMRLISSATRLSPISGPVALRHQISLALPLSEILDRYQTDRFFENYFLSSLCAKICRLANLKINHC